jgi:hypothetical protein
MKYDELQDGVTVDEVRELMRIYASIPDPKVRRNVMSLVASLVDASDKCQLPRQQGLPPRYRRAH